MKTKIKLVSITLLVGIAIATSAIAQTTNYVPKWNGSAYVNTITPIYEDATNNRIGIGNIAPNEKLEVSGNVRIGSSNAFMLAGDKVLWHNGDATNIFIGAAGNANMSGQTNTFVGG